MAAQNEDHPFNVFKREELALDHSAPLSRSSYSLGHFPTLGHANPSGRSEPWLLKSRALAFKVTNCDLERRLSLPRLLHETQTRWQ